MAPSEAWDAAEVTVGGDGLAARLDGERGDVGIWDEIPLHARRSTPPLEDRPVPVTGATRIAFGWARTACANSSANSSMSGGPEIRKRTAGWAHVRGR